MDFFSFWLELKFQRKTCWRKTTSTRDYLQHICFRSCKENYSWVLKWRNFIKLDFIIYQWLVSIFLVFLNFSGLIQGFIYLQIRLRTNSKLIWSEGMRRWRKEDWLCRRQREESRSGVLRKKERSEWERRGRLGKQRKGGRKRRRGGWRDRESWKGKGKKNVRKKWREKRWGYIQ